MKAEFHRPDDPEALVASAIWGSHGVSVESEDAELGEALRKSFRSTPVVVDDASYRRQGTSGQVLVQPGDLEWFRAVAQVRVPAETGLLARLVPGVLSGGYDPAAGYRTFGASIERLSSS